MFCVAGKFELTAHTDLSVDIHRNDTIRALSGYSQVERIDLPEDRS